MSFFPWAAALLLLALFLAWYRNWRGRLTPAEIDTILARVEARPDPAGTDPAALRRFLEADDGRGFFMLNLVRLSREPVTDPKTGQTVTAQRALQRYMAGFLPALLSRGGHPAWMARKVGPYVDAWGITDPDPDWTAVGMMRYRSRRDMMALAADPRFTGAHAFKLAAIPTTISFPTQPAATFLLPPTLAVPLVLALLAALGQVLWLLLGRG